MRVEVRACHSVKLRALREKRAPIRSGLNGSCCSLKTRTPGQDGDSEEGESELNRVVKEVIVRGDVWYPLH